MSPGRASGVEPMRVVFIGCVDFSAAMLETILQVEECRVVGIVTRRDSAVNADFQSLEPRATELAIPCLLAEGNDQASMASWIFEQSPDLICCFGWSYLLRPEILTIPPRGVIGYHPAALPRNRGRHPIIWALALGLRETASTFFFMDEGADTGDIIDQRPVSISENDDAATLYAKLVAIAILQVSDFLPKVAAGTNERRSQKGLEGNSWRKRGRDDGKIDWRMSSRAICNLVRALSRPYPGAHCLVGGVEIKVWKAACDDASFPDSDHLEAGRILAVSGSEIVVKCGEGAVRLIEHGFSTLPEVGASL